MCACEIVKISHKIIFIIIYVRSCPLLGDNTLYVLRLWSVELPNWPITLNVWQRKHNIIA